MKELLFSARQEGGLVVCAPVYAELLAYPGAPKDFIDTFLEDTHEVRVDLSLEIWTLSGEAFSAYAERRRKDRSNQPKRLLVNFMVGAHALLMADRLLTLGANRYRTTFPNSRLKPDDALPKD